MKPILEKDYNPSMGILIDVRNPISYDKKHNPHSINISYDKLLMNHQKYLNKQNSYYLICDKGYKSRKAARILTFYGYNVTYVINS